MFSFLQLHTSPTYEDKHSLLVHPDDTNAHEKDEESHVFSPILCRGVCDGGQIVWANTRTLEGLVGRTDLPLNSAVGVPICSVGYDLCILLLFAVQSIPMTPNSIEFLLSLARAASTGGDGGFVPASSSTPVTAAKTEQFVGLWDMAELLETYSQDVAFSLLPIRKLEQFLDFNETKSIIEFFAEYKQARGDGGFLPEQLQSLALRGTTTHRGPTRPLLLVGATAGGGSEGSGRDRSGSVGSTTSTNWFNDDESDTTGASTSSSVSLSSTSASSPTQTITGDEEGPGAFCQPVIDDVDSDLVYGGIEDVETDSGSAVMSSQNMRLVPGNFSVPIDSRTSYKQDPSRFHEFMVALLGMTVFDAGELWLVSEKANQQPELYIVAALYRDKAMERWTTEAKNYRLQVGEDIPGQVLKTAQPFWDGKYCLPTSATGPSSRTALAVEVGITTAFGVPLPGGARGVTGVLALYSKTAIEPEPLMVSLVQKGAQMLSAGALDPSTLSHLDIESIVYNPNALLQDWGATIEEKTPSSNKLSMMLLDNTVVRVNVMGRMTQAAAVRGGGGSNPRVAGAPELCLISSDDPYFHSSKGRKRSARGEDGCGFLSLLALSSQRQYSDADPTNVKKARRSGGSGGGAAAAAAAAASTDAASWRVCKIETCGQLASNRSPYCSEHSGTRRCQFPECSKCAQGATRFCIAHGGGRRCTFVGCNKGARDKFFCAAHGGGKRCERPGCTKSAVGGSGLCTAHGGGKRCQVKGCDKSSQSSTMFCVRHGGGRKCTAPDCTKVARGRTSFCAAHGARGDENEVGDEE